MLMLVSMGDFNGGDWYGMEDSGSVMLCLGYNRTTNIQALKAI